MEEAEALCDRLGMFVGGRLKAVGLSAELKQRLGKGLKITLTTSEANEAPAQQFLAKMAPGLQLINHLAGTAHYEVPGLIPTGLELLFSRDLLTLPHPLKLA